MQEFQVFDWAAMSARIRAKRVFLYCFIPIVFACILGLSYGVKTYFTCSVALAPEEMRATDNNRVITLNRPENYDLGITQTVSGISPEDYDQVIGSTAFLCQVLSTPVMTKDTSYTGTYYEYLATQYSYPLHKIIMRAIRGRKQAQVGEPLPDLDPFYLRGYAAEAMALAQKSISCTTSRRTYMTQIDVEAQDPLVAAMVAQSVIEHLEDFAEKAYVGKLEVMYRNLDTQIHRTYMDYEESLQQGDTTRAAMLSDACSSFERQAIVLNAQMQKHKMFSVLMNPSVPMQKAGPHRISIAVILTMLIGAFAILCICWRELFGLSRQ